MSSDGTQDRKAHSWRVHDLAKELGVSSRELLLFLKQRKHSVLSVSSTIPYLSGEHLLSEFPNGSLAKILARRKELPSAGLYAGFLVKLKMGSSLGTDILDKYQFSIWQQREMSEAAVGIPVFDDTVSIPITPPAKKSVVSAQKPIVADPWFGRRRKRRNLYPEKYEP